MPGRNDITELFSSSGSTDTPLQPPDLTHPGGQRTETWLEKLEKKANVGNKVIFGGYGAAYGFTGFAGAKSLLPSAPQAGSIAGVFAGLFSAITNITQAPQATAGLFAFETKPPLELITLWALTITITLTIGCYAALPFADSLFQAADIILGTNSTNSINTTNHTAQSTNISTTEEKPTPPAFMSIIAPPLHAIAAFLFANAFAKLGTDLMSFVLAYCFHNETCKMAITEENINNETDPDILMEMRDTLQQGNLPPLIRVNARSVAETLIGIAAGVILADTTAQDMDKGLRYAADLPLLKISLPIEDTVRAHPLIFTIVTVGILNSRFGARGAHIFWVGAREIYRSTEKCANTTLQIGLLLFNIGTCMTGALQSDAPAITVPAVSAINRDGPDKAIAGKLLSRLFKSFPDSFFHRTPYARAEAIRQEALAEFQAVKQRRQEQRRELLSPL